MWDTSLVFNGCIVLLEGEAVRSCTSRTWDLQYDCKLTGSSEHEEQWKFRPTGRLLYTPSIASIADFLADAFDEVIETSFKLPDEVVERRVTSDSLISLLRGREVTG